jgi:hypothetical protein
MLFIKFLTALLAPLAALAVLVGHVTDANQDSIMAITITGKNVPTQARLFEL